MAFFYYLLGRAEDLDLHRLPAQRALELPDFGVGLAQLARRHEILTGLHCCCCPRLGEPLQVRITLGAMSSSRLSAATVFSPVRIRWTVSRLNSVLKTRLPSAFRRCSPMGPPAASYVPTVRSPNGVHSMKGRDADSSAARQA
jgi:hypothetical protein